MDKKKVAKVQEWEVLIRVKDVQSFLGFANFYRRFIQGFSTLVQPLIALTQKDFPFLWTLITQLAIRDTKESFHLGSDTSTPWFDQTIYGRNWCL